MSQVSGVRQKRLGKSLSALRTDLLRRVRVELAEADRLAERLEIEPEDGCAAREDSARQMRDLLADRLAEAERQASRLMKLYVVTYQLHSTLEIEEVQIAIGEIAVDLLGAGRFMLLTGREPPGRYRIVLKRGLGRDVPEQFSGPWYHGGDPAIDQALTDGRLALHPSEESAAKAVIPLTIQDTMVGALVVLDLIGRRAGPLDQDRKLLRLLAAHAASALWVAKVYSEINRKLHTLESLLSLVRKA